jgi:DNA-binding GntR family transcriptional regulator
MKTSSSRRRSAALLTVSQLAERLRVMILDGDLKPGERLRQAHLAQKFGVSIHAVREALMELKGGGWVEAERYHGVFVSEFDDRRLLESLEVREVLEGLVARLCCHRINRENLRELRAIVDQIEESFAHDYAQAIRLDRLFHTRLAAIAGNHLLAEISKAFCVMGKYRFPNGNHSTTRQEHLAVLQAIEEDRPDDAEKLMREHIRILLQRTADFIRSRPESV